MRNLLGLAFFLVAAYFFMGSYAQRKKVRLARAELEKDGPIVEKSLDPNSMAALGEIATPIVQAGLWLVAIKFCAAYYLLDAGRFISLFDLAGIVTVLLAYGIWLSSMTKFRMPKIDTGQAEIKLVAQPVGARIIPMPATAAMAAHNSGGRAALHPRLAMLAAAQSDQRIAVGQE
jgi:hypothetical protein